MECPDCRIYMETLDRDTRQEWKETVYHCKVCNKDFLHRQEFSNGLVISDTLKELKE